MIAASQGAAATDATRRKPFVARRKKNSVLDNRCCAGASSQSYQSRMKAPSTPQRKNNLTMASTKPSSASAP